MGLAHRADHWPILRKVFRVGRQFVCGICRASFEAHEAARGCLDECWTEILTQDGVSTRPGSMGNQAYRCRFCSRDYAQRSAAEHCAKGCREQLLARIDQERLAEDAAPPAKKKPVGRHPQGRPQPMRMHMAAPKARKKAHAAQRDEGPSVQSDIVRQVTAAAESKAIQVTVTDETGDGPSVKARGRPRTEFKKTFIRDGAKYVCSSCRKNYFTKGEVEGCFDTHFDANGYEIVKG